MYLVKLLFMALLFHQLHGPVLSKKKAPINETKILENLEIYGRLLKQYLSANLKINADKETQKISPKFSHHKKTTKKPKLLVIALDGFRYDYVDLYNARVFKKLQNRGVYASEGLTPMFCTKTFPNFFSISSGVYQEYHGIIDNYFIDKKLNKTFDVYSEETHKEKFWFDKFEPIWVSAVRQGRTVGSCQWPATEPFEDILSEFLPYDHSLNFSTKLELAYDWLFNKDLDLVLTYHDQPDDAGHYHGPFSRQVQQEVNLIDNELSQLIEKLDSMNNLDQFNLLIIADHGMSFAKDLSYKIYLSDFFDVTGVEVLNEGTIVQINAESDLIEDIFQKLKYGSQRFRVYRKEDLPARLHYGYLDRLGSLVVMADEGYQIFKNRDSGPAYVGNHGYDNELYSMRPLFYGYGWDLKKNHNTKPFETINLYNLMCKLLAIEASPNNGTLSIIEPLLI